jgi:hypothetical protein
LEFRKMAVVISGQDSSPLGKGMLTLKQGVMRL